MTPSYIATIQTKLREANTSLYATTVKAGLDTKSVGRWISGKVHPTESDIKALIAASGVELPMPEPETEQITEKPVEAPKPERKPREKKEKVEKTEPVAKTEPAEDFMPKPTEPEPAKETKEPIVKKERIKKEPKMEEKIVTPVTEETKKNITEEKQPRATTPKTDSKTKVMQAAFCDKKSQITPETVQAVAEANKQRILNKLGADLDALQNGLITLFNAQQTELSPKIVKLVKAAENASDEGIEMATKILSKFKK